MNKSRKVPIHSFQWLECQHMIGWERKLCKYFRSENLKHSEKALMIYSSSQINSFRELYKSHNNSSKFIPIKVVHDLHCLKR